MYGYSGYGTNAYGSERQGILAPIVKLAMLTVQTSYGIAVTVRNSYEVVLSLMNDYNIAIPAFLRFRNLTLSNPSTNENTLEL